MRAKAGDPPRTICQKILGPRQRGTAQPNDPVILAVDQIAISQGVNGALADAKLRGLGTGTTSASKRTPVELAVAYDQRGARRSAQALAATTRDALAHGLVVSRAGMGFAAPVHLERFASPVRLCVSDSPSLAAMGGISMLSLTVSAADLGVALALGTITARMPVTISVQLTGRLRPFVSALDVALEIVRRGTIDVVRKARAKYGAPVVLEISGSAVRHLSIPERAHIAQIAPEVAAAAAVFPSDERTQVFLRDQRRSKAHRAVFSDPGAEIVEVVAIDIGAIDPLVRDASGVVKPARDLSGAPVDTILVGGDGGASLRDMLTFAALLKSKRVHDRAALLFAPPSRQILEVLARTGALSDLISVGARIIDPEIAVLTQEAYPGVQLRTCLGPPPGGNASVDASATTFTASAETCAHAVTRGEIGDPRSAKRVVRVTVPRELPTDDVLVLRKVSAPKTVKKA